MQGSHSTLTLVSYLLFVQRLDIFYPSTGLWSFNKGAGYPAVSSGGQKEKNGTRRGREKHANSAGLLTQLKETKS